jgi:chromosome segregation ATPase
MATLLGVLLAAAFACPAAAAQESRRPSRRATSPVRRAPVPVPTPLPTSEPTLVSSAADQPAQDEEPRRTGRRTAGRARRGSTTSAEQDSEQEQLTRTLNELTEQVTRLSQEMTQIKGDQRTLVDLERLSRAEQRAEGLRAQLRDVTDKEFTLQERAAQIEDEIDPGAIERRAALIGSLRPADVREQIRRSLERERERVNRQLEMLANSRVRLESAVATADLEVEKLRQRLDAEDRQQIEAGANQAGRTGPVPLPNTTTTPPPAESAQPPPPLER